MDSASQWISKTRKYSSMRECQDFAVLADKSCTQIFSSNARNVVVTTALWLYLIADFAEERLVRDPRWCGSRQDTGPQPELQQEEKYSNKSKNIYTTSWRHITRYPALQQQEWPHYLLSKGTKRYQNWCPIIFGCDDAMLCWLTAHSWRTLHSDGKVMAFLKQLWKTKRLI